MRKRVASFIVFLGVFAAPASAKLLRVDLSGYLYQVSPSVSSSFQLGNPVRAMFTFDGASVGQAWYPGGALDPTFRYYPDAPVAGWMTIGGYKITFSQAARMFVSNDESPSGLIDRLIFDDYGAQAQPVAGLPFHELFFNWQAPSSATDTLSLPQNQADFDRYGLPVGAVDWATPDAMNRVTFQATSLTVGAVPEPETWALLIIGMFGVAALARRKPRRSMEFWPKQFCVSSWRPFSLPN